MGTECNKKWKVSITSFANKRTLTNKQIDTIFNCYNDCEYQSFVDEITKKDKKYDIYPVAKWQLEKSREIEKQWHENIKYSYDHSIVDFSVTLDIDFPESFDEYDVINWTEGVERLSKIYLMVQQKEIVNRYKSNKDVEPDRNENDFLDELLKNQKIDAKVLL